MIALGLALLFVLAFAWLMAVGLGRSSKAGDDFGAREHERYLEALSRATRRQT